MKKLHLFICLFLSGSLFAQDDLINKIKDHGSAGDTSGYHFTLKIDLDATPVKNQASSGTCWSYASTSFIESEMIRKGKKPVDIAEMFTVRHVYRDKAEKYVRLHGHLNFAQGGALPDVMYVLEKYGAVPFEAYPGLNYGEDKNKHGELESVLKNMLDAVIKNNNGRLSTAWKASIDAVLDNYLGAYPETFKWNGKEYTPRRFADEVIGLDPDDYVQITSFTHAPFYEKMFIDVPDNWAWGQSYNMPLDEMMECVNNALDKGYSLSWATDVSEKGFSIRNGLAIVPEKDFEKMSPDERKAVFQSPVAEKEITQEMRQLAFDNFETTDDHGMHITGKATDQHGNVYYLVKNSWGDIPNENRDGHLYCSEAFLRYKTISIVLHKDAIPKNVRKKLKD